MWRNPNDPAHAARSAERPQNRKEEISETEGRVVDMGDAVFDALDEDRMVSNEQLAQLRSVAGQLGAVVNMVAHGASSQEVLRRLWSVQAELSAVGERMVLAQPRAGSEAIMHGPSADHPAAVVEWLPG